MPASASRKKPMICSSEKRFTSNLLQVGNWTPNYRATQNRGDVVWAQSPGVHRAGAGRLDRVKGIVLTSSNRVDRYRTDSSNASTAASGAACWICSSSTIKAECASRPNDGELITTTRSLSLDGLTPAEFRVQNARRPLIWLGTNYRESTPLNLYYLFVLYRDTVTPTQRL
jgi:hypothetical protein